MSQKPKTSTVPNEGGPGVKQLLTELARYWEPGVYPAWWQGARLAVPSPSPCPPPAPEPPQMSDTPGGSLTLDTGWTCMPVAARAAYRRLALMVYDLQDCQQAIAAAASRLPKPTAAQLFRLSLAAGELIEQTEAMRTALENIPPLRESRPVRSTRRMRPLIDSAVIAERKSLLTKLLAARGQKQITFCNSYAIREDDLSRWKSPTGGIKVGAQQDTLIRSCIAASDVQALDPAAPIAPIRKLGASEKIQ